MSAIENLIQIKKQSKNDDIVKMMDEVADYEKLSRSELFRDLTTSKVAQKKLPLLARAYQGDLYALSLSTLAGHIIAHLEDRIPEVLEKPMETLSDRDLKRMELMNKSLIPVFYRSLLEYEEGMGGRVVAVYSSDRPNDSVALMIIVRDQETYQVYQGYYRPGKKDIQKYGSQQKLKRYEFEEKGDHLSFTTYSLLGNNRYPFGQAFLSNRKRYNVSMDYQALYLEARDEEIEIPVRMEQRNTLNLCKTDPQQLGETILHWIHLYFQQVVIEEEGKELTIKPYDLRYGGTCYRPFGTLRENGETKNLTYRERGEGGILEEENVETGKTDWHWLEKEQAASLRALEDDPEAYGREVLSFFREKEVEDEHETITGDTGGRTSGDQADQGTEYEETVGEI